MSACVGVRSTSSASLRAKFGKALVIMREKENFLPVAAIFGFGNDGDDNSIEKLIVTPMTRDIVSIFDIFGDGLAVEY